ncbi:MAG: DUF1015 domain-containing protein [Candidatus Omnitrophota bacterium]
MSERQGLKREGEELAKIKPFKGILYNTKRVNMNRVVAPPYDVISPVMQDELYCKDQFNIVRLILGTEAATDTSKQNKYTRSKKFLDNWLKNKILLKDKKESVYVYVQQYLHRGKKKTRIGFFALMKIEDPKESGILPHEYTLSKPKVDRLNLIKKTRANLSPIFTLFQDEKNKINKTLKAFTKSNTALFTITADGVTHSFWRMDSAAIIKNIQSEMQKKKIFIADGHHRYEVALNYRNMMRKTGQFKKSMDYIMMYFSSLTEKDNLTILSTHRAIKDIEGFSEKEFLERAGKYFYISKEKDKKTLIDYLEENPGGKHAFGIYLRPNKFYLLKLKDDLQISKIIKSKKPGILKRLDVTVLHDLIINKILGVENTEGNIKFIRDEDDAVKVVDSGDYRCAFFLRPTKIAEMKNIAEKGVMMPQKSTYFYPKLLTGLVINKF